MGWQPKFFETEKRPLVGLPGRRPGAYSGAHNQLLSAGSPFMKRLSASGLGKSSNCKRAGAPTANNLLFTGENLS